MTFILTLNAGSSSLKYSLWISGAEPSQVAGGLVENIGSDDVHLELRVGGDRTDRRIGSANHKASVAAILDMITPVLKGDAVAGVGHRIVHGGINLDRPMRLDGAAMTEIRRLLPFAPLHQPHNIAGIEAAQTAFPAAIQIGCFDTAFHRTQPRVCETYALPRSYYDARVRRYGFHGLSYEYIAGELKRLWPEGSRRAIVAHLGNGASICGLLDGKSMATTMGFSALDGLPMGTRSGQIDPGVIFYLMQQRGMSVQDVSDLLYKQSGLLGLSGLSNDMRTLEAAGTPEAEEAIAHFVHRIQREIGGLAAVLGGVDCLIFTAGIGEHSARLRQDVCAGLGWMGITLDDLANHNNAHVIGSGPVTVGVLPTNEELVIARAVNAALHVAAR